MLRFFKDICAGILLMELPYPSNISGKKMGVIGNCGSLVFNDLAIIINKLKTLKCLKA